MNVGILYMLMSALMQAFVAVIIKCTSNAVPISLQLAFYYTVPIFCFFPLFFKNGFSSYGSKRFSAHFIRGFFSIASVCCFFYAIKGLPLGISTTLFNTIPFFVPLISYFFLKEKIRFKIYLGLSVALSGILLIINPRFLSFSIFYFMLGLSAAILMAAAIVFLGYLTREKESVNQIVFNQYSSCSLMALLFVGVDFLLSPHKAELIRSNMNITITFLLIGLGLLSVGIQYCFSKAAQWMTASQFAPFLYMSVPVSSLLGFIIWGQNLSLNMIIGAFLIFIGLCVCSLWREKTAVS